MTQRSRNRGFVALILLASAPLFAQRIDVVSDIRKIDHSLSAKTAAPNKRSYIYKNDSSLLKKINPLNALFGGALYAYQNVLSKHISADCLYSPSCSEFSKEAVHAFGLLKGSLLTFDRLNRCNRIAATDLKHYQTETSSHRFPDPVSKYK